MAELRYLATASLDGFVADSSGSFDWAAPGAQLHAYVNDRMREVGTHLYGRRMYEVMSYWETADAAEDADPIEVDFARIWQAADKIVFSTTLPEVSTARTRLERSFDPDAVARLKAQADADLTVGGPQLAAAALRAGLVDELELIVVPIVVGGGSGWLPPELRCELELVAERRFDGGFVSLRHRVRAPGSSPR